MSQIPQKIVITGASRGIGRELALKYGRRGSELVLMARSTDDLAGLSQKIESIGGRAHFIECDVSNRQQVHEAFDYAKNKLRNLDIVFLNAGVGGQSWFAEGDVSQLKKIIEVNVLGVAYAMECVVPAMKQRGRGKIAITGSLAESRGFPGNGAYCASKAAIGHIAESARVELKEYGIDVITIKPGFIRTDMTDKNDFYMPFLMEAAEAADLIVEKIDSGYARISFPMPTAFASWFGKLVPGAIFEWFAKMRNKPIMK